MSLQSIARWSVLGVLLVVAILAGVSTTAVGSAQVASSPTPSPTPDLDWDLPGGHYYTQAGAGKGGYTIADDGGMAFWTAFQRLGGTGTLGYPASRRFVLDGLVYQATQAALLQWRPDQGTAVLGNTFELLQRAGKDDWLYGAKGIPRPIADDGAASFDEAVRIRLGWLTEPAIRDRYFANPNPAVFRSWSQADSIQLYGLPMSKPERLGPFIAQRFQRIAFQLWVDSIPGAPPPGSVTPVLGGDLLKETGLLYGLATTPHASSELVSRPVPLGAVAVIAVVPTAPVPSSTPVPGAVAPSPTVAPRPTPTSAGATAVAKPGTLQPVAGTLSEYSIALEQLSAKPGVVRFTVTNTGTLRHNLHVAGSGVDTKSPDLRPGQSGILDVTFTDPGPFTVYCDIADHAEKGMRLTFTIEQ